MTGWIRSVFLLLVIWIVAPFVPNAQAAEQSPISVVNKYAWSENSGWLNFKSTHSQVYVHSDYLTGYVWAENIGWIKLGVDAGGPYDNTSASNWGVNRNTDRTLSGFGWSEVAGWVNFNPTHSQVTIGTDGWFDGYAWCERVGWIHLRNNTNPAYGVQTLFGGAPVAGDQNVSVNENTPVAITLSATDPDGDPLTYQVVTNPTRGSLSGSEPNLTYTPDTDYVGTDRFTFKADDGEYDSNTAGVNITVNATGPENQPPTANDQRVICSKDTPVDITLTGSDPEGDALSFFVVDNPSHGVLTGTAPELTYIPNAGYVGEDAFTFKVNDGLVDSEIGAVDVSVASRILTTTKSGSGTGTVTSSPGGIACGDTCRADFPLGAQVVLTASAATGSAFDGWSGGCSGVGPCTITMDQDYTVDAAFNPDGDEDDVSDDVENGGPNDGDGNDDGVQDAQQNNVTTFKNIRGAYVTLETDSELVLGQISVSENPSPDDTPAGVAFPGGFCGFRVMGVAGSNQAVVINLVLHNRDTSVTTFFKYGPTPEQPTAHWYDFAFDGVTGAVVTQNGDNTIITLTFRDGLRGDDDLSVNGQIIDDGAPATAAAASSSGGDGAAVGCFLGVIEGR